MQKFLLGSLALVAGGGLGAAQAVAQLDRADQGPVLLERVWVVGHLEDPLADELGREALDRFRGTGNAEALTQVSGLQLNNIRNEAGALDVGIRGIQGEGRVPVYVDGSLQSTHTWRGYQGESDRSYIDLDFIGQARVDKGSSIGPYGAGAVGGVVQLRTLTPEDVLLPGKDVGVWMKARVYNNNRWPQIPADEALQEYYVLHNRIRPGRFANGALTLAWAWRTSLLDAVVAVSRRRTGNYFAGSRNVERYADDVTGLATEEPGDDLVVKPGQEVVNTSFASVSTLAKLGWNIASGQRLELNYRHHEQRAGEVMAAYWYKQENDINFNPWPPGVESMPQWALGTARVDAYRLRYGWRVAPYIDMDVSIWQTRARLTQHNGLFSTSADYGDQYRHSYADTRDGFAWANRSELGGVSWHYGVVLDEQRTRPRDSRASRDARRRQYGVYVDSAWRLWRGQMRAGVQWHGAQITDFASKGRHTRYAPRLDLRAQLELPLQSGLSVFAKAGRSYRNPSLFEGSASGQLFNYDWRHPLRAERLDSLELGLKAEWEGVWQLQDSLVLRLARFENWARHYISAAKLPQAPGVPVWKANLSFQNYDVFRLGGFDLGLRYEHPRFFITASAMRYDEPWICLDGVCNSTGFSRSLISSRVPPRHSYAITAGLYFLDGAVTLGARLRYHSGKQSPVGWLAGTAAPAVKRIPQNRTVDVFASYRISKGVELDFNIDNLTNQYAYDPGTVIAMPLPGRTVSLALSVRF
ncbi:extracellular heme-binding protein [Bordetella trematum]|uniref:Extracellular heme-binding protein n=1 Tax=Bordetella trematum TaxID=123899 RepID=A0A157R1E6_9BORD|nr:TonB-dependent receptor [Bordetella trematum]NNH21459.1 TonB-dependent receptor [Bordetella trematum]SAI51923.1 extracellular heme-binding protein [Bordetella trematum]SAI73387.1 extracellular heme-binding protein [Bordetella trematum]SUV97362.1 extracellular heme-binding protein [Bordetella trematum]